MLEVAKLSCVREDNILFSDLSFTVSSGEIVQIEGPNGVGKTSLLRLLAGLSSPADGHISWQQTDTLDEQSRKTKFGMHWLKWALLVTKTS